MAISRLEPSNDQANAAEVPGCLPYEQALARFLHSQSETDRTELCLLARELAAQRTPIAEALENNWRTARSFLCCAPDSRQPECVEAIVQSQRDLGEAFDHALRLEARAHTRLASAYAQKTREVTTFLDSLPAFAFMKDSDFRYAAVNQVFCEALGRSPEDLISKTDFDLFPKIVAQRFVERDREVLRGRSAIRHEETVDINGQLRTVLVIKAPVLNPNGTPTGLIGVGFDITERKRIEQEHTRLAAALESAGEAVLITDTDGTIQFVNPAFERLTGYSRDEAIGRNPRILKSGYHGAEFYRKIWETLGRGQVWQGTIRNKKKDGRLFDADQTLAPVQDREGKTNSYVGVVRDITERKRMVESLQRAVMVKVEFTSMVSHELRTPLTAIKEAIDVVADQTAGPVNQHQAEFLALAKRNVDRLHRLINDTLDFSKLERGEFRLGVGPSRSQRSDARDRHAAAVGGSETRLAARALSRRGTAPCSRGPGPCQSGSRQLDRKRRSLLRRCMDRGQHSARRRGGRRRQGAGQRPRHP